MASDYGGLGLRMGIEIHQQLEGKKLFCNCPTIIRKDKPDFVVKRELRAAAGETGEIDIAAAHEQSKAKHFLYQGYKDDTCLVELDEEPPHPVNREALKVSLQIAGLLNAKIVDSIQFMRKTVVDGSNTSGFQRTALVARDGHVDVNGKKISIPTVCLEEEACQVIERTKEYDSYNLSRLGIPLIEIATGPDIETPEECRDAAAKLGMILRSVPGMKRGIGTIRQDVNMSIKGQPRVEIKGFQEYKSIPTVIDNEIRRQLEEIKKGKKLNPEVRKAEDDFTTTFLRPMPGAARMYPETDIPLVKPMEIKAEKVELIEEKAEKIKRLGLGNDLANATAKIGKADLVLGFSERFSNVKPAFIAETIVSTPITIKRKDNVDVDPSDHDLEAIFSELNNGKIAKDSVYNILTDLGRTGKLDFGKYKMMSDKELEAEVRRIVSENKGKPESMLIGIAMGKLKGKADSRKVIEIIKKTN
ncbi:Glu-tRNA(Gln) amidotransferase GatDE subunit E [Candidatus Woesearchaeota archaeon CG10_big_fil_rev_8_21_14_0_10_44_13]|nr:MAG: Glu-tRNA(Gln) amidotransferase GatDE subunit E [Candidatus Woesearchaeota archaeon CG10_big_fil_rev_8_21_14_0_10_44_13]